MRTPLNLHTIAGFDKARMDLATTQDTCLNTIGINELQGTGQNFRFLQIDVLRGFAVLGIYWINIFIFGLPTTGEYLPAHLDNSSFINSLIHQVTDDYLEGSMRALFSMLFGASALLLLSDNKLAKNSLLVVEHYYRRTLLLMLFGFIHAYILLWPFDVLYVYGLLGLFLFPLRKLKAQTLLLVGILLLALGDSVPYLPQWLGSSEVTIENVNVEGMENDSDSMATTPAAELTTGIAEPADETVSLETAADSDENSDRMNVEVEIATYRSDYATIFAVQQSLVLEKHTLTLYQDYIFDIGGMMLLGMGLMKLGVMTGEVAQRTFWLLLTFGYLFGFGIRYVIVQTLAWNPEADWPIGYSLGRLLVAMGHIGLIGVLCNFRQLKWLSQWLSTVGRMALTNYIMQTILSAFIFYGFGLGLFATLQRVEIAVLALAVWVFLILFSCAWLSRFRQGPLEWVWRTLIYAKMQPFSKFQPQASALSVRAEAEASKNAAS